MTTTIERPILFNGAMVRAILEGRKTQTRRVVKPQPAGKYLKSALDAEWLSKPFGGLVLPMIKDLPIECPYGQPGDRLWVRETFAIVPRTAYRCSEGVQQSLSPDNDHDAAIYREGWSRSRSGILWRPSIHMPRWASRILLEITAVRVERLQDISEADARAEGISDGGCLNCGEPEPCGCEEPAADARDAFCRLWQSINGEQSWHENPWVWVIEFKRVQP